MPEGYNICYRSRTGRSRLSNSRKEVRPSTFIYQAPKCMAHSFVRVISFLPRLRLTFTTAIGSSTAARTVLEFLTCSLQRIRANRCRALIFNVNLVDIALKHQIRACCCTCEEGKSPNRFYALVGVLAKKATGFYILKLRKRNCPCVAMV